VNADRLAAMAVCLMPAADVARSLGFDDDVWARFAAHWDELAPDPYAAELGMERLRRYGHYSFSDGVAKPIPIDAFVQPHDSNPLYIERDRHFEPLTDGFAEDPLLDKLLQLLARFATALDNAPEWTVKVHPFRVIASADVEGLPTPEGVHRDGVTLVTSLLIGRRNALGGESSVLDLAGRQLLAATLCEPGSLLLGDDRRTVHAVSPIRALDCSAPAVRDVLVITFAS
jgi:hypothetical protein